MLLTLPFEQPAQVERIATAVVMIGDKRFDCFAVTEPVYGEAPVIAAPSHCTRCGCLAPAAARACLSPDCPSRVAA